MTNDNQIPIRETQQGPLPELPIPDGTLRELRLNVYRVNVAQRMIDGLVKKLCLQSGADPAIEYVPDLERRVLVPIVPVR
jgi:hypothetical protein